MVKFYLKNKKILRDLRIRKQFKKKEILYFSVALLNDIFLQKNYIENKKLKYLTRFSTIKNKCLITGDSKIIFHEFRLTRTKLRNIILFGNAIGIKKSY